MEVIIYGYYALWVGCGFLLVPAGNENGREDTKTEKQAAAIGANPAGYRMAPYCKGISRVTALAAVTSPHPFNDLADHGANCGANDLISHKFKRKAGIRGERRGDI